jgi:hypothetical protein
VRTIWNLVAHTSSSFPRPRLRSAISCFRYSRPRRGSRSCYAIGGGCMCQRAFARRSGWLASGHTDMHKGIDALALLVQETPRRFQFQGRSSSIRRIEWSGKDWAAGPQWSACGAGSPAPMMDIGRWSTSSPRCPPTGCRQSRRPALGNRPWRPLRRYRPQHRGPPVTILTPVALTLRHAPQAEDPSS